MKGGNLISSPLMGEEKGEGESNQDIERKKATICCSQNIFKEKNK